MTSALPLQLKIAADFSIGLDWFIKSRPIEISATMSSTHRNIRYNVAMIVVLSIMLFGVDSSYSLVSITSEPHYTLSRSLFVCSFSVFFGSFYTLYCMCLVCVRQLICDYLFPVKSTGFDKKPHIDAHISHCGQHMNAHIIFID